MGENSAIEWTHHTFNAWWGCQRKSPGCENCYAETLDKRVGGGIDPADGVKKLRWGPTAPRLRTGPDNWKQPLRWEKAAVKAGERHRVFCNSMADVFEVRGKHQTGGLDVWRLELFDLIRRTPHLIWMLLTKRPESIRDGLIRAHGMFERTPGVSMETVDMLEAWTDGRPPANVALGATVENQECADERISWLHAMPAAKRFLSAEPLLEGVQLEHLLRGGFATNDPSKAVGIDWLIIGGESGNRARPFHLDWARELVFQARRAGVVPFVKQLGTCAIDERNGIAGAGLKVDPDVAHMVGQRLADYHGGDMTEWPEDLRVREFPCW